MADETSNLAESLEAELNQMAAEPTEESAGGGGDAGGGGGDDGASDEGDVPSADASAERDRNLGLILDIPLKVTVELGRTKMVVSDLLNLGQGSVIELSKLAGEPMEVLVNDKLVARGEAVVVNEKFGVRLTDIISPSERVEQLK